MKKLNVVFDTNMFLHSKMFTKLKWDTLVKEFEDWVLLIPDTVHSEIDKRKYDERSYIKKRAKKVLKKITDSKEHGEIDGIRLRILNSPINWKRLNRKFRRYNIRDQDQLDNDTRIFMEILQDKLNNSDQYYKIFTNDSRMQTQAQKFEIESYYCAEDKRFEKETSVKLRPQDVKKPILKTVFFNLKEKEEIQRNKVQSFEKIEYMEVQEKSNSQFAFLQPISAMDGRSIKEIELLNSKVDKYHQEMEKWCRIQKCDLKLWNIGSMSATDIDVYLEIETHSEVKFYTEEKYLELKPEEPYLPKSIFELPTLHIPSFNNSKSHIIQSLLEHKKNEKNQIFKIRYHLDNLKHNNTISLIPLYFFVPMKLNLPEINLKVIYSIDEPCDIPKQTLKLILK